RGRVRRADQLPGDAGLREGRHPALRDLPPALCAERVGDEPGQPAEGTVRHDDDDVTRSDGVDEVVADRTHAVDGPRRDAAPGDLIDDRVRRAALLPPD